jgi:hypothetical protein
MLSTASNLSVNFEKSRNLIQMLLSLVAIELSSLG